MSIYDEIFNAGKQSAQPQIPGMGIAEALMGIYSANQQGKRMSGALEPTSYDAMYQQFAQQLQQLTGQLADSTNPEFQRRVQQRQDEIMRANQDSMRQQQSLNASRAGRGLQGLVNPERRDEAQSRNIAMMRQQAEAQARAEVTKELAQAAQSTTQGSQSVAAGLANERARRAGQANVQNAYGQTGGQAWMGLAKEILGATKGMDWGKALGVTDAMKSGGNWGGGAQDIVGSSPLARAMPNLGTAVTQPNWDFAPGTSGGFDMGGLTGTGIDWGTLPQTLPDIPQWDIPQWDSQLDWGTGFDFGNMDYGSFL